MTEQSEDKRRARLINTVLNRLLDGVDVNRLVARVDVEAVTSRANVGGLVAQSTSHVAGSTLDIARRQAVGLDTLIMGLVDRLLGRDPAAQPLGPPGLVSEKTEGRPASAPGRTRVSGYYAGPLSRLLAYLVDSFVVFTGAGLITTIIVRSINVVLEANLQWDWRAGVLGIVFDARQRALHDVAAKTAVVYDWGDRPAELPAPLSKWLTDHGVGDVTR